MQVSHFCTTQVSPNATYLQTVKTVFGKIEFKTVLISKRTMLSQDIYFDSVYNLYILPLYPSILMC